MEIKELKGFLGIWTDMDKDFIPRFREWHSKEHMVLRIATPGWYVGHRYYGLGDAPDFLICYETLEASDLGGKGYHQSLNVPDANTREALSHYRNSVRTIYRLVHGSGERLPTDSPYYLTIRFECEPGGEAVLHWFEKEHFPRIGKVQGVLRARLYEVDEGISQIMTEERKLYNAGPGKERFLATYEIEAAEIPQAEAWQEAFAARGEYQNALRKMKVSRQDLFSLEFTIYPPKAKKPR